jgi:hypothetical protein
MYHLTAAAHSHFLIDIVDMVLDRVVGNEEQILDLLVAFALQDELHDLPFPLRDLKCLVQSFQEFGALLRGYLHIIRKKISFQPDDGN